MDGLPPAEVTTTFTAPLAGGDHEGDDAQCTVTVKSVKVRELPELGFVDVFRLFEQPEKSYSWWDYRAAAFRRNHGLRIDLILASAAFAQRCTACTIDREPRRAERPSDHTPVIATFDI